MTNSFIRVAVIVGLILLIPVFGNLYVEGWNWSPGDFAVMGALLFVFGIAIDYAARKVSNPTHKALAIGGMVFAFLVIWSQLAVQSVSQAVAYIF